jgi:chromosomal replication initiator protein
MEYIEGQVITQGEVVEKQIFNAIASVLGKQRFDLWFGQKTGVQVENDKVVFSVQSQVIDWMRSSLRFEVERACESVFTRKPLIEFVVSEELSVCCVADNIGQPNQQILPHNNPNKHEIYLGSTGTAVPPEPHFPIVTSNKISSNIITSDVVDIAPIPTINPTNSIVHNTQNNNRNNTKKSLSGLSHSRSETQSRYVTSSPASPISNIPRSTCRQFASLETFVDGQSNGLARRGINIALNSYSVVNPIYIYGASGVGKTHLLEGLWSQVRANVGSKPPLYMTTEQFVSAFLDSIQSGSLRGGVQKFRERFKGISYLLLDDIQCFSRKEATQTEFLHIMDLLLPQGVQIVLTGDRSLGELGLRGEIISRLESGMSCKVELPERELLLKVIYGMVKRRGMNIGEDVCRFICSRIGMNARRISGALNRLFVVSADDNNITVEKAEELLKDMFQDVKRNVRLSDIGKIVSEEFGLLEGVLQSRDRTRQVNVPRMLAMWLARKYTRFALSEIGRYFGSRSHSTVVTAQKKVDEWIDQKNSSPLQDQNINITQTLQCLERKLAGV